MSAWRDRSGLADGAREKLAELAELMIPAASGMPSAGEVGVAGAQLDRVLGVRPDLREPVLRALSNTEPTGQLLANVEATDPEAYVALCLVIAGGYYMHPEVRRRLGYDGQEPDEVRAEIIPGYIEKGLLEPVLAQGPRFRAAPDETDRSRKADG
ncbi:MAG: hypothetical protein GEU90_14440 [Gemmatimonas sp.]|nr:hypothetical protein [Gemmatimonas sp.]